VTFAANEFRRAWGLRLLAGLTALTLAQSSVNAQVVISQLYGAGGTVGATYLNDYIELFNQGASAQSLNGWSVQYASATGSSWTVNALPNVSLNPGQYFLIQGAGSPNGAALPTPDLIGSPLINMSGTAGKVALCNSTTALTGTCPTGGAIQDFVGYGGTANCNEGGANAPGPSTTNAIFRAVGGCTDDNINSTDFASAAASPRNTASPTNSCTTQTNPSGAGTTDRVSACRGTTSVNFTVTVNAGTNPTSTAHTVTGDFSSIGGPAAQVMGTDSGPYTFTFTPTIATTPGLKTIPFTIQETAPLARSGGASFSLNVVDCSAINYTDIKISQVYGGGGNTGATYKNDFVELFNVGAAAVDLAGYSIQYASAAGAFSQITPLSGTILPGHYFLIQEAAGTGGTTDLPTPDVTGTIAMSATAGHIVLTGTVSPILSDCTDPTIIDLVAYNGTTCFEGTATASLTNTTAAIRNGGGCVDTNNNQLDFTLLAPTPRNSSNTGNCAGTPPTGSANPADPDPICAGNQIILSVAVTPGTLPPSTGLAVSVNLAAIGGSSTQQFFDDGPGGGHGDAVAGDNTFSFNPTIPLTTSEGTKTMLAIISDAELRSTTTNVVINEVQRCVPTANGIASPPAHCTTGGLVDILVFVSPASTGVNGIQSVTSNLSAIGGDSAQMLFDDGTNGDRVPGDFTYTFQYTVPSGQTLGAKNLPYLVTDFDNRTAAGVNTLTIITCSNAASTVVISQVYGGGGNTGAQYRNDFIELFNRSGSPVDIGGWSVQYSSAGGVFGQSINLPAGPINLPSGGYYLVQGAAGNACAGLPCGDALPTADFIGGINLSGTDGKVALVNNTTSIGSDCNAASIMDLVGYGSAANCFEGGFHAAGGSNSFSMHRLQDGCQDTNQNAPDFFPFAPAPRNTATALAPCPVGSCTCRGDVNGDTVVNGLDINSFVACLTAGGSCTCADVNNDSASDPGDITPFINALLNGACAP